MSKFSKEELMKIKEEWEAICKAEDEIDYSIYCTNKMKRRFVMSDRAYNNTYRKRIKRRNEILNMFRNEIRESVIKYAKRRKYLDENGKLIFIDDEEGEQK